MDLVQTFNAHGLGLIRKLVINDQQGESMIESKEKKQFKVAAYDITGQKVVIDIKQFK